MRAGRAESPAFVYEFLAYASGYHYLDKAQAAVDLVSGAAQVARWL